VIFEAFVKNLPFKGTFLSESTDVFVITSNRRTFFFPETETENFIFFIFKAALASQRWPSCPYKPLSFQTLGHPQFQIFTKIQIFSFREEKCSSV
jgi:hypothetical protein